MSMSKRRIWRRYSTPAALLLIAAMRGLAADPAYQFVGNWRMNAAQSSVQGAELPKSYDCSIKAAGPGRIQVHVDWVTNDGGKYTQDWSAQLNGESATVTGDPAVDSVKATSQDLRLLKVRFFKSGKIVEWGDYAVSPDGKTLLAKEGSKDEKGATVLYNTTFDRQ